MAEHLAKTHLLLEPFCVSKDRQLSERHPLHQIIKYHCRGIHVTDKLSFKVLLGENGFMHRLWSYGYYGASKIAFSAFRQTSWKDTDFMGNIKVKLRTFLIARFFKIVFRRSGSMRCLNTLSYQLNCRRFLSSQLQFQNKIVACDQNPAFLHQMFLMSLSQVFQGTTERGHELLGSMGTLKSKKHF